MDTQPYQRCLDSATSKAIFLNNEGANCLKSREYRSAVVCLTAALKESKNVMQQLEPHSMTPSTQNGCHPENRDAAAAAGRFEHEAYILSHECEIPPIDVIMVSCCSSNSCRVENGAMQGVTSRGELLESTRPDQVTAEAKTVEFDEGYVYSHPIFVPPRIAEIGSTAETKLAEVEITISTAIIFNLALAHHLQTIEVKQASFPDHSGLCDEHNRKKQQRLLERASHLYDLVYQLQIEQTSGTQTLFIMAVLNNCGQIASWLRDDVGAKSCFNYLLSVIMCTIALQAPQSPHRTKNGIQKVPEDVLDGFFRSASCWLGNTIAAAAA